MSRLLDLWRRSSVALADLLWPPRCVVCDHFDPEALPLCGRCSISLPPPRPRCPRCGRVAGPFGVDVRCHACQEESRGLDGVVAAWSYAGTPRDLVLALKFRRRLAAAIPMATALTATLEAARIPGDLLVPVPLSGRRLAERGFNQAEVLARRVAHSLGVDMRPRALRRRRHTAPQATLHGARRRRAPRGAFRATPRLVLGRSVLLVDDVLTTGATLEAAAAALRRAGARGVVAAVVCRTEGAAPITSATGRAGILGRP